MKNDTVVLLVGLGLTATLAAVVATWSDAPTIGEETVSLPSPDQSAAERSGDNASAETRDATTATSTADASVWDVDVEYFYGYPLKRDRNCDPEIVHVMLKDGSTAEALKCTPRVQVERAYAHYDNDALREMAYADAGAAAELGYRIIYSDNRLGIEYMLRAVALDTNYAPKIETIRHAVYPQNVNVDNQLDLAAGGYVFAHLRSRLDGDYDEMLGFAREHFESSGGTDEQRLRLEKRSEVLFEYMKRIRQNVTGDDNLRVQP